MAPTIAIIGAGAMGSAVAARLVAHGCKVLAVLDGRSAASQQRALAAGMQGITLAQALNADLVLSIVPPAVAQSVAQSVADVARSSTRRPVFVDCNAVSPQTVLGIESTISQAGLAFVDGGIIGPPPSATSRTVLYACGEHARALAQLNERGLHVEVLTGPIGAASALKMCFAGMSKGVTALCSAMMLAASRAGAADALRAELVESRPELLDWAQLQVPKMFPKAYRWVGEMEEIAQFSDDPGTRQIYLGIARVYERLARDLEGAQDDKRALEAFLAGDQH